jgi:hypothetical protein
VHLAFVEAGVGTRIEKASLVFRSGLETAWAGAEAGLDEAYLAMEGTLGAAEGILLRGGISDAALAARASVGCRWRARAMGLLVGSTGWLVSPASHHNEFATRGARADRVGAKPLL